MAISMAPMASPCRNPYFCSFSFFLCSKPYSCSQRISRARTWASVMGSKTAIMPDELKVEQLLKDLDMAAVKEGKREGKGAYLLNNVGPNPLLLEAQGKVCTGPAQTKPLGEDQASKVLDIIVRSVKGEIPEEERASEAQIGAFFAAMAVRANSFPPETQWSIGECRAIKNFWPSLVQVLPPDILFIADSEGTLMEGLSHAGATFIGRNSVEMRMVGALRDVLKGDHLGFEEVVGLLRDVLPVCGHEGGNNSASDGLMAAFFIALRMNRETDRELKGFCIAFDEELGDLPVADVKSLTHYGEPYDGNTRFFRSTLFVAAVRASYGEACLMHGVEWMPPKGGVTEEQMLKLLGASMLSPSETVKLLEDEDVGFAYVSQRDARPQLYSLIDLREHVKKRPTVATTEKVQQYVMARGRQSMIAGFYHEGYEEPLLMLMRRRGVDAGMVIKGEEGALTLTTKSPSPDAVVKGRPVNFCSGFRPVRSSMEIDGLYRETFNLTLRAEDYGFASTQTPRIERPMQALQNLKIGISALQGQKGAAYDRIVFNAAMTDYLLGCDGASDPHIALQRAREAIDSGKALQRLFRYVDLSKTIHAS